MLRPDFPINRIEPNRRNAGNSWFKRGTLYRSALDVLRTAGKPLTAREMAAALLDGKTPTPSRQQEKDIQARSLPRCGITKGQASNNPGTIGR